MTNRVAGANKIRLSDNRTFEVSGPPRRRIGQILGTAATILSFWALIAWMLSDEVSNWMHLVLLFALVMQTLEAFLCADDYEHLDLEKRALVKTKWYSFMGFGRKETPFSAFSAVVIQHVSPSAGKAEETFIARVGFKTQDGGPVHRVKEFTARKTETPGEAEEFARELSVTTGLPYCGHTGSG